MENLYERFEFRTIRPEEAEAAAEIEAVCFPPNEACSRGMMLRRNDQCHAAVWAGRSGTQMTMPKDPMMLPSFLNMKLRDGCTSLREFCDEHVRKIRDEKGKWK